MGGRYLWPIGDCERKLCAVVGACGVWFGQLMALNGNYAAAFYLISRPARPGYISSLRNHVHAIVLAHHGLPQMGMGADFEIGSFGIQWTGGAVSQLWRPECLTIRSYVHWSL